jgi:hypothetical protein
MKPFIYGNKKIEFGSHSGEVIGYDTIVKTHVSGSGGGGYNGRTAPVRISSHNEVIQNFFLKDVNNQETSYTLSNLEIPLHDGQKITMISGRVDGKEGKPARIIIHSQNGFWNVNSGNMLAKSWGLIKGRTLYYLGVGFVASLVIWVLGSFSSYIMGYLAMVFVGFINFILFVGTVIYCFKMNNSNKKIVKKLDEHMDELARGLMNSA